MSISMNDICENSEPICMECTDDSENTRIRCGRCKMWREDIQFIKNGKKLKTCDLCRIKDKKSRDKNRRECDDDSENTRIKCVTCKTWYDTARFVQEGKKLKTCDLCRIKAKEVNDRNKCQHGRQKCRCKDCDELGTSFCKHGRRRNICNECSGSQLCNHGRIHSACKECSGGSICNHERRRTTCIECNGGGLCNHKKDRTRCKDCNPLGHLSSVVRCRIYQALKNDKKLSSNEYLCCDMETLKTHIEEQFEEGMTWKNYGSEWHIDHDIPLMYENPTHEEVCERLYYLNTQPMWASENISKGNRFIGKKKS